MNLWFVAQSEENNIEARRRCYRGICGIVVLMAPYLQVNKDVRQRTTVHTVEKKEGGMN